MDKGAAYRLNLSSSHLKTISNVYFDGKHHTNNRDVIIDLENNDIISENNDELRRMPIISSNSIRKMNYRCTGSIIVTIVIITALSALFLQVILKSEPGPSQQSYTDGVISQYITPPILNDEAKPMDIRKLFNDLELVDGTKPMTLPEIMSKIRNSYLPNALVTGEGHRGKSSLFYFIIYEWETKQESFFKGNLLCVMNFRDLPITEIKKFVNANMEERGMMHGVAWKNLPKASIKRFSSRYNDEIYLILDEIDELQKAVENPSKLFTDYDFKRYNVLLESGPEYAVKMIHSWKYPHYQVPPRLFVSQFHLFRQAVTLSL